MDVFAFPPELVSPKDKEKPEYGLQYVKAAYYSDNRYGSRLFNDDLEFDSLIQFAQGRQSVSDLKQLFGLYARNTMPEHRDGPETLVHIDPQTLPLAPKYINRAVGKMQANNFDIGLDAIDLLSVNEKSDQSAVLKAFYRFKDWVKTIGIPLQAAFPDVDISTMPEYPDELMFDINTNPKLKKEIDGEMALKLVMGMNNFKQKMRQVDWDLVVIGRGHIHTYTDHNGIPRMERINPKYWGGSYVDNDDFEEQEYAYFLDCITVNQFIREAADNYSQAELQELIQKHGIRNSTYQSSNSALRTINNYDNLTYMPVMRFYFRSEDSRTFVTRKNSYGNKILLERSHDYKPSEKSVKRFEDGGDSKVIKNTYTSIYGGTWILDSDCVYNYKRQKTPRTNLVEATLPIKTFATNFKDGRAVSFTSQMVEPVFMANVAWNKIKTVLAKEWVGVREIDFTQIEGVALGKGGRQWTSREVIEFLEMSNTLVKRSNTNPNGTPTGPALQYHNSGVDLATYFTALSTAINMLEQLTGTTMVESAQAPDRLAVGVMKASQISGDLDMEYLYNAHQYLYERTAHQLLLLTQQAKRDKVAIRNFTPALGYQYSEVSEDIAYCEYGMLITKQPSPEEWASFYMDMSIALKEGRISSADSAFVREIDNLKQARQVLVNREKQYQRRMRQEKERDIQANMEANMQSSQAKMESEMAVLQATNAAQVELLKLQGQIDSMLQKEKSEQDAILSGMQLDMKAQIEKQKGIDEIMKQGIRNIPEKQKVQQKGFESVMQNQTARMKVAVDKIKAEKPVAKPAKK